MRALARLLQRSPFRVFASYRTIHEWWDCGLTCVHPVARIRVTTTGKEVCARRGPRSGAGLGLGAGLGPSTPRTPKDF